MDKKESKNPLLAGLINVLIPGSSHVYVNKDWGKFIRAFLVSILVLGAGGAMADIVQGARGFALPQGVCTGTLLLIVASVLFSAGYKIGRTRLQEANASTFYNSKRQPSHGSIAAQHAEAQKMRYEGLISEQEFEDKNEKMDSNG